MEFRKMTSDDLEAVSELGIRSKRSWNYDSAAMSIFERELTMTEERLESLFHAEVATEAGRIIGYATVLYHEKEGITELDHLFVDPDYFGMGCGTELMVRAIDVARQSGAKILTIICDPNAVGFYLNKGAKLAGEHQSSIAGRKIPIVEIAL